jgi:hypothetical protein
VATNGDFGEVAVIGFFAAAAGRDDDSLTGWPVDGGGVVAPGFGPALGAVPRSVPVSLGTSGTVAGGGDAAAVGGLPEETLGLAGDDSTFWFERSHVKVAMNVRINAPAIRAPIASGRDDLLDSTAGGSSYGLLDAIGRDSSCDFLDSAGRDCSRDVCSAGRSSDRISGGFRSSAIAEVLGSTLGITAGALTKTGSGESTAFPRAAQKSSRFFRLVATKG